MMKSEADVEDMISLSNRILNSQPRFTVHTNLQDAHLYLLDKPTLDQYLNDKSMTTLKGDLIPRLVDQQFKKLKKVKEGEPMDVESTEQVTSADIGQRSLNCTALVTDSPTVRVNNIPAFWEAFRVIKETDLTAQLDIPPVHKLAQLHQQAQVKECNIGANTVISEKTNLSGTSIGSGCTIKEKVIISNSIIMDNVQINPGVTIKDSIVCELACVEGATSITNCIVGRQYKVASSESSLANQILLDSDRMMHV
eukprot:TRINITY_DN28826_c0_g1_i1.p1 TRINITY_DN28826_c0_g1~~TRINITY_DN28826_c0_g1_i1.p1  ORF type:complete len:253 (-),score=52.87 TRINITY_DN28826_c0_g1_i1:205-963(-)